MSIKNVAIIGAAGNLGAPVTKALLESGFAITAISRPESTSTFPAGVAVKKVDLSSVDALTEAFKGQDAVISLITTREAAKQNVLADAAVAAGVKRYIPSEFGVNSSQVAGSRLAPGVQPKAEHITYITGLAQKNPGFTWTGITCGPFFDYCWNLKLFGVSPKDKYAAIVDSGNERFGATTLPDVAKGVVGVLTHLPETANKYIAIQTFETCQNEILAATEKVVGFKLSVLNVTADQALKKGDERMAEGDYMHAFIDYLAHWFLADGSNHKNSADILANDIIGLKQSSVEDVIKTLV
ncbi:hypothetical protein CFIMG_005102RAa [Ceratocystis fimbriata CBS 114723]|uniref:NmrA-like domain-containing protein n=1 Tax=Ceratocystis fimbriata CBS 114723 TaxID=1035309 RepID=A0A2C5WX12_9PEZI|nr:hypothetical protein CFIMG_005102RAa [Ceratocystis fimbriata CBS 114723]